MLPEWMIDAPPNLYREYGKRIQVLLNIRGPDTVSRLQMSRTYTVEGNAKEAELSSASALPEGLSLNSEKHQLWMVIALNLPCY